MICIAVDLNLFDRMEEEDGSPKSSAQLATITGSDQVLLSTYPLVYANTFPPKSS